MAHTRRPPKAAIPVVIVVLALASYGAWLWFSERGSEAEQTFVGTIEGTEYRVAPAIAGRIETVTVGEGDEVAARDELVRLDDGALALQVRQAEAGVRAARAKLSQAKDDGTDADVEAAKAGLEQARAALSIAKIQLGYAAVKAPHDGVVVAIAANVGENAAPGRTVLTLLDTAEPFVRFFVPETRISRVALGDSIRITTTEGEVYEARVDFIASQAEFTPNNVETKEQRAKLVYEARATVAQPKDTLKPGMTVDVAFE